MIFLKISTFSARNHSSESCGTFFFNLLGIFLTMFFLKLFNISNDKEIFLHYLHVFFCVYKILHLFPNIATYFATFFQKFSLITLEFPHHCFKIFSSNCYTYFNDKVIRNSFWLVGKIALSPVQHPYICQII